MLTEAELPPQRVEGLHRVQLGKISVRVHASRLEMDDEHRLIARYVQRLANDINKENAVKSLEDDQPRSAVTQRGGSYISRKTRDQYQKIAELEAKNRDIMYNIHRLRQQQQQGDENVARLSFTPDSLTRGVQAVNNPVLAAEIVVLRHRRDELESRMTKLQASREELTDQLHALLKLIKTSPGSSPHSLHAPHTPHSTPASYFENIPFFSSSSHDGALPHSSQTPHHQAAYNSEDHVSNKTFHHTHSHQIEPIEISSPRQHFTRPRHVTTTDATDMPSVVMDIKNDESSTDEDELNAKRSGVTLAEYTQWKQELHNSLQLHEKDFLSEIGMNNYMSKMANGDQTSGGGRDSESYVTADDTDSLSRIENDVMMYESDIYDKDSKPGLLMSRLQTEDVDGQEDTDQESYIRTDDEEAGNTDWEDSRKRWINR